MNNLFTFSYCNHKDTYPAGYYMFKVNYRKLE